MALKCNAVIMQLWRNMGGQKNGHMTGQVARTLSHYQGYVKGWSRSIM